MREHTGQFEQQTGARPAIIGSDEAKIAKLLRVVVAGENYGFGLLSRDLDDDILHLHPSPRCKRRELLEARLETITTELASQIAAGLLECSGAGWARAKFYLGLDVGIGPRSIKVADRF